MCHIELDEIFSCCSLIIVVLFVGKSWKRMVTKVCYVGEDFTRKPPKFERFIRPMVGRLFFITRDHSFSTYAKFSEKPTFLNH